MSLNLRENILESPGKLLSSSLKSGEKTFFLCPGAPLRKFCPGPRTTSRRLYLPQLIFPYLKSKLPFYCSLKRVPNWCLDWRLDQGDQLSDQTMAREVV